MEVKCVHSQRLPTKKMRNTGAPAKSIAPHHHVPSSLTLKAKGLADRRAVLVLRASMVYHRLRHVYGLCMFFWAFCMCTCVASTAKAKDEG